MQYGDLITRSFSIVWRHRYLWLLAILGGADVTTSTGVGGNFSSLGNAFNGGQSGAGGASSPAGAASAFGRFLQDNLGTIVVLGAVALVVAIAWWLLSCVTTGALVRATAEHDAERPFGLGVAWRTGLGTFWSILGLRLLGLLWGVVVLGTIAGAVVLAVVSFVGGQNAAGGLVIALGLLLAAVLVLASIPIGIAFILGTRAVVLEQRGAISALGRGFQLLGSRLGPVLVVWLLQVALALAAGVGLAFVFIPVVLLLFAVGVAAVLAGGVGAAAVAVAPLVLLLIALGVVAGGLLGAYLSAYWTLAFRRLEVEPAATPQTLSGPPRAG